MYFKKIQNNSTTIKRKATAVWNGTGKEGKGHLTTQSTILNQTQYSFGSRFEEGSEEENCSDCKVIWCGCNLCKCSM